MTNLVTSRAPAPLAASSALQFAVFLDFDGTLVDIAARPELVRVDPDLLKVLDQLKARLGGALAIVSGRSLAVLDHLLAPLRFDASGLHGAECRRGEETWCGYAVPAPFRRAVEELKRRFAAEAGLLVEDKGKAVSLHWREAPHRAEDAVAALSAVAGGLGDAYRIQRGKAVAELVPAGASKGSAIAQFLAAPPYQGRCPVFIGDDLTDEHGFEVVNAKGGLSAHVGSGPTHAQFRLPSPAEVRAALRCWAEGEPIGFPPVLSTSSSSTESS